MLLAAAACLILWGCGRCLPDRQWLRRVYFACEGQNLAFLRASTSVVSFILDSVISRCTRTQITWTRIFIFRITVALIHSFLSLVNDKSCSSKHWSTQFCNIRLRLTIHFATTCVHTQLLKLPSRETSPIYYHDSNLKLSSPFSQPSLHSYVNRTSRHTGRH